MTKKKKMNVRERRTLHMRVRRRTRRCIDQPKSATTPGVLSASLSFFFRHEREERRWKWEAGEGGLGESGAAT